MEVIKAILQMRKLRHREVEWLMNRMTIPQFAQKSHVLGTPSVPSRLGQLVTLLVHT